MMRNEPGHPGDRWRWMTGTITVLAVLATVLAVPEPAKAYHLSPVINCLADDARSIRWSRERAEGTNYYRYQAVSDLYCSWHHRKDVSWQANGYVDFRVYRDRDQLRIVTFTHSPAFTLTLNPTTSVASWLASADGYWTGCQPSETYTIRTEAFYRFRPYSGGTWSQTDSIQTESLLGIVSRVKLC